MNIFPSFILAPYSCYFLQLLIVIVSLPPCSCLYIVLSNCNVFVYVTFSFFKVSYCNCFDCNDFCYLVSLKHTLKKDKKGRAFRNIGKEKYISLTVKSALLLYYLFYNLLLIRSFTTGSGTFILSRWSLLVQLLVFTDQELTYMEKKVHATCKMLKPPSSVLPDWIALL